MRNPLVIRGKKAQKPIIQGGMGIGISLDRLAGAVAKEGGVGTISAANPGYGEADFEQNPQAANTRALSRQIGSAKEKSEGNGLIAVNIMVAMRHYDEMVACCVEHGADVIVSGAGLPLDLPKLTGDSDVAIAPIVSSLRSVQVLLKRWDRNYHRTADLVIIEGPKAGGHLGFSVEEIERYRTEDYEVEIGRILELIRGEYEPKYGQHIPVVFGGGVFTREDVDHVLSLGCDGVQMATRFVVTEECDADIRYKEAYLAAEEESVQLVESPVGMPGRAIANSFLQTVKGSFQQVKQCFGCLRTCTPQHTPYCISRALMEAARGRVEDALLFCGETVSRLKELTTVRALMEELG